MYVCVVMCGVVKTLFDGAPRHSDHGEDGSAKLRLAGPGAGNARCVANHVLRQCLNIHSTKIVHCVAGSFRVVPYVPLLGTQSLIPLHHIQPPITKCHMRLVLVFICNL